MLHYLGTKVGIDVMITTVTKSHQGYHRSRVASLKPVRQNYFTLRAFCSILPELF